MIGKCNDETVLCDVEGCTEAAVCRFSVKGRKKHVYLCGVCRLRLYAGIAEQVVPKSPRNRIAAAAEERNGTIKRLNDETKKD